MRCLAYLSVVQLTHQHSATSLPHILKEPAESARLTAGPSITWVIARGLSKYGCITVASYRAPIRLLLDGFAEGSRGLLVFVIAAMLGRTVRVPRSPVRR